MKKIILTMRTVQYRTGDGSPMLRFSGRVKSVCERVLVCLQPPASQCSLVPFSCISTIACLRLSGGARRLPQSSRNSGVVHIYPPSPWVQLCGRSLPVAQHSARDAMTQDNSLQRELQRCETRNVLQHPVQPQGWFGRSRLRHDISDRPLHPSPVTRRLPCPNSILLLLAALMWITHSAGRHQVRGNMRYSLGKSLSMRLRLRASKSLRQISSMPGKWLIF